MVDSVNDTDLFAFWIVYAHYALFEHLSIDLALSSSITCEWVSAIFFLNKKKNLYQTMCRCSSNCVWIHRVSDKLTLGLPSGKLVFAFLLEPVAGWRVIVFKSVGNFYKRRTPGRGGSLAGATGCRCWLSCHCNASLWQNRKGQQENRIRVWAQSKLMKFRVVRLLEFQLIP